MLVIYVSDPFSVIRQKLHKTDRNEGIPQGAAFHASNRVAHQQTGLGPNNPFARQQQQQQPDSQQPDSNSQPFFSV